MTNALSSFYNDSFFGKVIKLLCSGKYVNGKAVGTVRPEELEKGSVLASIDGTSSMVSITTDLMGTISIIEHNPEIEQTAYGIFSDLIRIISTTTLQVTGKECRQALTKE